MSPEHAQLVGRVRSSAAALAAAVRTVPAGKETQTPAPGEWSVREIPDADWQRAGRHPERGAMSIEFLARWAADHAEDHAAQIAATAERLCT